MENTNYIIDEQKTKEIWDKLDRYNVVIIAPEYPHRGLIYKDVRMFLFMGETPEAKVEYEELVYPESAINDAYIYSAIQDTFDIEEVKQIITGLMKEYSEDNIAIEVRKASVPLWGCMGHSAIPIGGYNDNYEFYRSNNYQLDFPVIGYFDLRDNDTVSE